GFTAACRTDNRERRACRHVEIDVDEHWIVGSGRISEGEMPKFDFSADLARNGRFCGGLGMRMPVAGRDHIGFIADAWPSVQNVVQPSHRCCAALKDI